MYMVFFVTASDVSRTEPITSFVNAVEAAKAGPSGAKFMINNISNPDNYVTVLQGYVA